MIWRRGGEAYESVGEGGVDVSLLDMDRVSKLGVSPTNYKLLQAVLRSTP